MIKKQNSFSYYEINESYLGRVGVGRKKEGSEENEE